jgi:hypothetical protein
MAKQERVNTADWRIIEVLKLLRQCVTCPICGVLIATDAGIKSHYAWHTGVNTKVDQIDNKFSQINQYVRGSGGLEERITAAFITDRQRLTAIEQEITRATTGILARLTALEARLP